MAKTPRDEALAAAAEQIRQSERIVVACHVNPDADALGSLIGMAAGLTGLGKQVTAISPDGLPAAYRFLPGSEILRNEAEGSHDLAIGLDADGISRLGRAGAILMESPVVINIDHHTGPEPYGDIRLVDPTSAATGELVFELLEKLHAPVDYVVAQNLLAAILTDTGSFRFSSVTGRTMRIAGALIDAGARPEPIYEAVYGTRSYGASRVLGRVLEGLGRSADGRVVWGAIRADDLAEFQVTWEEIDGFIEQIRCVEGSAVAVLFSEVEARQIRVSLRSRGQINVAAMARRFGGGGHRPAAGCTIAATLDDAREQVLAAIPLEAGGDG